MCRRGRRRKEAIGNEDETVFFVRVIVNKCEKIIKLK